LLLLEVFFAFLILFAIFTFAIRYLRIYQVPLGFDTEDISIAYLSISEEVDSVARIEMFQQLRREMEAYPEIEQVAFQSGITPFTRSMWTMSNSDNGFELRTCMYATDEHFGDVMNMNLVEGRWYTKDDLNAKYPPVVINRKLREQYFGDAPLIDSILSLDEDRKVVGVVDYFKYQGPFAEDIPLSFTPLPIGHEQMRVMLIRLRPGTPPEFEENINNTIAGITKNRDFVIESLESNRKERARTTWVPLVAGLSICGFLMINVALGLFGVLYYNISKRRSEIGLRRAIGSSQGEVRQQFTIEIFLVTLFGMALAAILAVQFPLLEVVDIPADNFYLSIAFTTGLISIVVLLCALWPSHQAAQIHPAIALHEE
jgi:putative ABC transport system permease protein